jgi:hypothetical protein
MPVKTVVVHSSAVSWPIGQQVPTDDESDIPCIPAERVEDSHNP